MTFFPQNGFEDLDPDPYQNKADPQHKNEETDKKHSLIGISVIFFTGTKFWEKDGPLKEKKHRIYRILALLDPASQKSPDNLPSRFSVCIWSCNSGAS